jgi:hypothetical protein
MKLFSAETELGNDNLSKHILIKYLFFYVHIIC